MLEFLRGLKATFASRGFAMKIRAVVLTGLLVFGTLAYADTFELEWSGTLQSSPLAEANGSNAVAGSAIVTATEVGVSGTYLVNAIESGSQNSLSLSYLPVGAYDDADNLLYPAGGGASVAGAVVDNDGWGFSDGSFDYIIYEQNAPPGGTPAYWECTTENGSTCIGSGPTEIAGPVSLTLTDLSSAPEPSAWMLLGTALLGLGGTLKRKLG
jgi:hypothetical protein